MTAAQLQQRLMREVKESPAKAIALGAGLLVALVIWVPKLLGATQHEPSAGATDSADPAAPAGAVTTEGAPELSTRDSLAIRSEFIAISQEARELRRFADALAPRASERDPFERPKVAAPVVVEQPAPDQAPAGPDPEQVDAERERGEAGALKLGGTLIFGSRAQALIGGALVREGDLVPGSQALRVKSISPREVVLKGVHAEYRLAMNAGKPASGDQKQEEDRP